MHPNQTVSEPESSWPQCDKPVEGVRAPTRPKDAVANDNMSAAEKVAWLKSFPDEFGYYPDDGRLIRREE